MITIIAGGRSFSDYPLMIESLDNIDWEITEIVSGTAYGADTLGEAYASDNEIPIKKMPADWDKYGRSAGFHRNVDMAKYADACVAFWDGRSRGTMHMITLAKKYNCRLKIVSYQTGV